MTDNLQQFAYNVKRRMLDMAHDCGTSVHIGGALSMAELISVLYGGVMRFKKDETGWDGRDRFILSKGHCVLAFYSVLAEAGIIKEDLLATMQKNGSLLSAHPVMNLDLGIESSNGSLGQGLSMAVGMAKAGKLQNKQYNVYVLLGNGECDEGAVWEAAMLASQWKLDNLTVIVDNNKLQSDGASESIINLNDMSDKWRSFGFAVDHIDGHNIQAIYDAYQSHYVDKPKVIVADTVKGHGISFMENNNEWHHNRLTDSLYEQARIEQERSFC